MIPQSRPSSSVQSPPYFAHSIIHSLESRKYVISDPYFHIGTQKTQSILYPAVIVNKPLIEIQPMTAYTSSNGNIATANVLTTPWSTTPPPSETIK